MSLPQLWSFRAIAHPDETLSLRQALTQQKPCILSSVTSYKNSRSEDWPNLPKGVTIWKDFNLATLNESYRHVLDVNVPAHQLQVPLPEKEFAGVVIDVSKDVNHLVVYNDNVMKPTLRLAKSYFGLHSHLFLRHRVADAQGTAIKIPIPNQGGSVSVAHIIELDDFPAARLIVGLARPSSKWSSAKLPIDLEKAKKENLWPLRQLANACKHSNTPYGYIQTEEELVACRFTGYGNKWKAEIMPIPWSRHGANTLTTDLALWWLCMLAMADRKARAIVNEPTLPPPPLVGNMAAYQAAVDPPAEGLFNPSNSGPVDSNMNDADFQESTNPPSAGNMAAHDAAVGPHAEESWCDFLDFGSVDSATG